VPKCRPAKREAEDPLIEDPEAGELGKPFTQLTGFGEGDEEVEEWEGLVDWEAGVVGQAV
jgi:hypothetical protein